MSKLKKVSVITGVLLSTSCASIISKSDYPVNIDSNPSGMNVQVLKDGHIIHQAKTPTQISLPSGDGFFQRAHYKVKLSGAGVQKQEFLIKSSLDGWYFGNLLFGGLIGMLIVDPATGAMYKLKDSYMFELKQKGNLKKNNLNVYSLETIPQEWHSQLEEIKQS